MAINFLSSRDPNVRYVVLRTTSNGYHGSNRFCFRTIAEAKKCLAFNARLMRANAKRDANVEFQWDSINGHRPSTLHASAVRVARNRGRAYHMASVGFDTPNGRERTYLSVVMRH